MRIVVFGERLRMPLDEGFKNTTVSLAGALREQHDVQILTTLGEDVPPSGIRNVQANKLLLSRALRRAIHDYAPDVILYVPTASATPSAMLRTRVLASFAPGARVVMVALQPRAYSPVSRLLIRLLRPPVIVAQSAAMAADLAAMGCRVARMGSGVDTSRFAPLSPQERRLLRARLGFAGSAFVVLHAGHINEGRNVQVLERLQQAGCQSVLIGSTSTEQDAALADRLRRAGVVVIRDYLAHIEQYYQAADCYVFPVVCDTGAIAVPLSVLEAMACNLPVVSVPYGDLPALFAEKGGFCFAAAGDIVSRVLATRSLKEINTRSQVLPHSWHAVASAILDSATGSTP